MADDWKRNLIDDDAGILEILRSSKRVAVLGIKPESHAGQPAFDVAAVTQRAGFEVIPVPVYYPEVTTILGRPVFRSLAAISPPPVDIVDVFRKPTDVPGHLEDFLAARPKVVWMQSGISHPQVAETLARAGIKVVQDRCLKVEIARLLPR